MYHLTQHERVLHSAEEIGHGLISCLESKHLNEVTISDIHRATGISRSTIYRLFDTPEDILIYLCDKYKQKLANVLEKKVFHDVDEAILFPMRYTMENYALLEVLIRNHRNDLLDDVHEETVRYLVNRLDVFRGLSAAAVDYMRAFFYETMTTTLITWVQRGRQETPEQLKEYIIQYGKILEHLLHGQ